MNREEEPDPGEDAHKPFAPTGEAGGYRDKDIILDNEMQFQVLFKQSAAGVARVLMDGSFQKINPKLCNMMGYEMEELIEMNFRDITYPGDLDKESHFIDKVLKGEMDSYNLEKRYVRKDGSVFWVHLNSSIVRDPDGKPICAFAIIFDIDIRKKQEEEIARSNAIMKDILENTSEFIMIGDENAKPIMFNSVYAREMKKMLGIEMRCGFNPHTAIGDPETDAFWEGCHRRVLSGERFTEDFSFPDPEGRTKHYSMLFHPIIEDGKVTGFTEYTRDVTDLYRTQKALIESEERFRSIFDHSPVGIALVSLDFRIYNPNKSYCDILGYEKDELVGKTIFEITHPSDRETNKNSQTRLGHGDMDRYGMDKRMLRKDGSVIIVNLVANLIHDNEGNPSHFVGIITDVTRERESRARIKEERERAEFYLDLLGHDIGNLHQGIYSGFQLVKEAKDPRTREIGMRSMDELTTRSIKLVKNVLLLSRLKEREPELIRMDVLSILKGSIDNVKKIFSDREVIFDMDVPDSPLEINAEPIVEEVFLNIIHNGIKFQYEGTPRIDISARNSQSGISILISDHGPGIPDDAKSGLFRRFSPKGKASQTGIGLSIAKVLAERYNAKLEVSDRVEGDHTKGLSMMITFPLPDQ